MTVTIINRARPVVIPQRAPMVMRVQYGPGAPGTQGDQGPPGPVSEEELQAVADAIDAHMIDPTPHPAYDDLPDFTLLFENGLV